jgi:uncharacterized membrane protein YcjF (UPF0283 family)
VSLNIEDAPNQEEIAAVLENARERLRLWGKRMLIATMAWLLSCAAVWLFTTSGPWHAYWRTVGVVFLLVAEGLMLVFVYCFGLWMTAWFMLRSLRKTYL